MAGLDPAFPSTFPSIKKCLPFHRRTSSGGVTAAVPASTRARERALWTSHGLPAARIGSAREGSHETGQFASGAADAGDRNAKAFATTGCWHRRPRSSGWRWRDSCSRCRRPTHRRSRTRRPTCAAWRPSTSSAARIAGSGAGLWSSIAAPTARPSPRPCLPPAEAHRDAQVQPHSVLTAGSRMQARVLACRPRHNSTMGRAATLAHRPHATFIARMQARRRCTVRCNEHRHCPHRPLKLTLPTQPTSRRFSSTRFI